MPKEGQKGVAKVSGKEYPLQHPGIRWYLKHTDKCKNQHGVLQSEKYIDGLLENVVISDVKIDDFESINDLHKLIEDIESFLGA